MNLVVVMEDYRKKDNPPWPGKVVIRQKQTYHQKKRNAQKKNAKNKREIREPKKKPRKKRVLPKKQGTHSYPKLSLLSKEPGKVPRARKKLGKKMLCQK